VTELHASRERPSAVAVLLVTLLLTFVAVGALGSGTVWAATTTGSTPVDTTTPPPTTTVNHTVTMSAPPTTVTEMRTTTVSAAVTPTTTTSTESESSGVPGWGWALIGAAVIVLLGGVFALGRGSSRHSDRSPDQPPPGSGQV
jgi:hypothetical protein